MNQAEFILYKTNDGTVKIMKTAIRNSQFLSGRKRQAKSV